MIRLLFIRVLYCSRVKFDRSTELTRNVSTRNTCSASREKQVITKPETVHIQLPIIDVEIPDGHKISDLFLSTINEIKRVASATNFIPESHSSPRKSTPSPTHFPWTLQSPGIPPLLSVTFQNLIIFPGTAPFTHNSTSPGRSVPTNHKLFVNEFTSSHKELVTAV